jgi:hypothetical protein
MEHFSETRKRGQSAHVLAEISVSENPVSQDLGRALVFPGIYSKYPIAGAVL